MTSRRARPAARPATPAGAAASTGRDADAGRAASAGRAPAPRGARPALLPREFFARPADQVAPDLLGCVITHETAEGLVAVALAEVEAYAGEADPASHAFRGRTARNAVMYGPAGHAYVYFTYGMHFCVNVVCQPEGEAQAVLLRAGRVIEGLPLARARRGVVRERDLARGPARLCEALAIDRSQDGTDVVSPAAPLRVWAAPAPVPPARISSGPRVGVSRAADIAWRFWITGDAAVSPYRPYVPKRGRAKPVISREREDGTMPQ